MRITLRLLLNFIVAAYLCANSAQVLGKAWPRRVLDDPLASLSTRSEEEVQKLSTAATAQYKVAADAITSIMQSLKNNEVKKINPKEFGTAYVAVLRMRRMGKQLEQWGETAGIDFQKRAEAVLADFYAAKIEFLKLPEVASKIPGIMSSVNAEAKKRQKNLVAAANLFKQQRYVDAETALNKDLDVLEEMGGLLDNTEKVSLKQFWTASDKILEELNKQRVQAGKDRLLALIEAEPPGFEPLLAQMKQAVTDLKAGQNPKFDGQEMSGPEFVAAAGEAWRKTQLAALHVEGYYFSMNIQLAGANAEPFNKLASEQEAFAGIFLAELESILAADAARTSAAEAESVYLAYLKQFAPLATLAQQGSVEKAVSPSLESLVARSPELQANVAAYESATGDLLRWRKLVADQQQKTATASFATIPETFIPALSMTGGTSVGLLAARIPALDKLAILSPLPLVLERMKTELIGKQMLLPACVGIAPAKKLVASHYLDRHYATFTLPAGFDVEQQALRADLMVSEELPPLTLAAAKAVVAADRGDLQAAGVVVNRITIESLATRLATLPAAASPILPLGPLPRQGAAELSLNQVLLRSDVQPTWVRNEYFFVGQK